jgi:hypothetical protein
MTNPALDPSLALALAYGKLLIGTPYAAWDGTREGIHSGAPFFAGVSPLPAPGAVRTQSLTCAGLVNLVVQKAGCRVPHESTYRGEGDLGAESVFGGTAAYEAKFATAHAWERGALQIGTILGRGYKSMADDGHVAVVVEGGLLLQSFPMDGSPWPGVNTLLTIEQSEVYFRDKLHVEKYFEYAVPFETWRVELSASKVVATSTT